MRTRNTTLVHRFDRKVVTSSSNKQITNVRQFDVNFSLLALPCLRTLLVQGGYTAYLAVDGLLASYLSSQLVSLFIYLIKHRQNFTTRIELPPTPFGNGYLSTITQQFRVIADFFFIHKKHANVAFSYHLLYNCNNLCIDDTWASGTKKNLSFLIYILQNAHIHTITSH